MKNERARSMIVQARKRSTDQSSIVVIRDRRRKIDVMEQNPHPSMLRRLPNQQEHYFRADVYRSGKVVLHEEIFHGHDIGRWF